MIMMNTEFITQEQQLDGDERVIVMSKDGKAFCSILYYANENVQELFAIYVTKSERRKGRCKELLDYVDSISKRKHTWVAVKDNSPEWLIEMFDKRGYIIRTI